MSNQVIDASIAVKLIFQEDLSNAASRLVREAVAASDRMFAPMLLPMEMTNVIRKRARADGFGVREALRLFDDFAAYPIILLRPPRSHHRALELAISLGIGGHDAHYLALAELLNADFWTADQRLIRATTGKMADVRWIGDHPLATS